jgi:hypothetical protein
VQQTAGAIHDGTMMMMHHMMIELLMLFLLVATGCALAISWNLP